MPLIPDGAHRIELPGYPERVGKVRHTYDMSDGNLLMVASDRVSTFDVVHPTPIPGKGKILTQISAFWFKFAEELGIAHHLISADTDQIIDHYPHLASSRGQLDGRTMLVGKQKIVQIEAIVRGNITGSGWKDYKQTGKVCGIELPKGLQKSQRLEQPIFTPSTKAEEGHDRNISFEEAVEIAGEEIMEEMRRMSILLFTNARDYAASKGIVIADTKFEYGWRNDELVLADEVLTPDSSRFWPADQVILGQDPPSFDKQIVRNFSESTGWDKKPPAPALPQDVVGRTYKRYDEVDKLLRQKAA